MRRALSHPLGQAAAVLVASLILFEFGIPYIPPLFGVDSAPVPDSVLLQFMITVLVGVLIWASASEERWRRFREPFHETMVREDRRGLRIALLVAVPLLVGFVTFRQVRQTVAAPPSLRSIHPAPPGSITFRGETMQLAGLENPLRADGSIEEDVAEGARVYYRNCMPCHGDALSGDGRYAHGFQPQPLAFTGSGTIAQLTESFVFWRIAEGGPGLPTEGAPWNSAMPAWEEILTKEEIWSVIVFLYERSGNEPRTWEETAEEGEAGGEPAGEAAVEEAAE
ncbi:MAG: cytochrome c [Gemmatimonadota bacterium]|nr:cytochrome c [Gemmatimonadota bacterium]